MRIMNTRAKVVCFAAAVPDFFLLIAARKVEARHVSPSGEREGQTEDGQM